MYNFKHIKITKYKLQNLNNSTTMSIPYTLSHITVLIRELKVENKQDWYNFNIFFLSHVQLKIGTAPKLVLIDTFLNKMKKFTIKCVFLLLKFWVH